MDIPAMKLQEMNEEKDIFRLLDRGIDDMKKENCQLMKHLKWLQNWGLRDEMKERKVIVTWEAIYDIVDIAESIELNRAKR